MAQYPRGKSLLQFPHDYVMIDTETTGLSPAWDDLLEISAISVKDGKVDQEYSKMVKFSDDEGVPDFITELTGITTEMIQTEGIDPKAALGGLSAFVGDSLLVGYNINFDLNFLTELFAEYEIGTFDNDYVDVWRLARRFYKGERHNRVADVLPRIGITHSQAHRALADCYDQKAILDYIFTNGDDSILVPYKEKNHGQSAAEMLKSLVADSSQNDEDSPFFDKQVCFTGALEMVRRDAAQIILNIGGHVQTGVNKQTDYLVVGDTSYSTNVKDGVTGKMKRARELMGNGQDITILTESLFKSMLEEDNA